MGTLGETNFHELSFLSNHYNILNVRRIFYDFFESSINMLAVAKCERFVVNLFWKRDGIFRGGQVLSNI